MYDSVKRHFAPELAQINIDMSVILYRFPYPAKSLRPRLVAKATSNRGHKLFDQFTTVKCVAMPSS